MMVSNQGWGQRAALEVGIDLDRAYAKGRGQTSVRRLVRLSLHFLPYTSLSVSMKGVLPLEGVEGRWGLWGVCTRSSTWGCSGCFYAYSGQLL
jgi:hypothetical protein